uniref:non-specific serine/threonine protein kinase n=1 Tax=Ananas comosus var. bracteatus TaxID=296719 RepID=A0A6V7PBG8_ANACO|nr:unnamed protein product [Ananas comosus var. bracteatus]
MNVGFVGVGEILVRRYYNAFIKIPSTTTASSTTATATSAAASAAASAAGLLRRWLLFFFSAVDATAAAGGEVGPAIGRHRAHRCRGRGRAGLLLVLMVAACVCTSRRKSKKPHNPMKYYADADPSSFKGSSYYSSGPRGQWPHNGHQNPPPPPPGMVSGAMSSGNVSSAYSGPLAPPLPPPSPALALGFNKSTSFAYEELVAATNGFAQADLLGQGGFGYVHKGVLPNGKEIAVKQLKAGSRQGEREFHAEVDIIGRVHHRHLVSLVGYCVAAEQRLLVYEFVPNKTLEHHLHGQSPRFLVADFGLAKLSFDNHTHVSTRVMGTFGYLAPEYASSGKLTEKSDVFSYGVMLLELITGRRPVDSNHTFMEDSLVDWARPVLSLALADGNYDELADPRLDGNYDLMEMARMVACAAACVRHSARRRPRMSQIVRALEGDVSLEDLNEGVRPGQSMLFSSGSGSEYESPSSYTANMQRIRKVVVASPEYSGEYGDLISEYGGHDRSASSGEGP